MKALKEASVKEEEDSIVNYSIKEETEKESSEEDEFQKGGVYHIDFDGSSQEESERYQGKSFEVMSSSELNKIQHTFPKESQEESGH